MYVILVIDSSCDSTNLFTNQDFIFQRDVLTFQVANQIVDRMVRSRNIHCQRTVYLLILCGDERTRTERLVIHHDTHFRMFETYWAIDVQRVIDIAQQETITLHRHPTGV